MEKLAAKARDIKFFSSKNGGMVTVHSVWAKKYAEALEEDESIKFYRTNVALENWIDKISTIGLRTSYLQTGWSSDFMLVMQDDNVAIRELVTADDLKKKAEIEKLEISRRYWKIAHVSDWGVVMVTKEGAAW